ncbi:hypothetical protein BDZ91DRAFT_751189 [Kalaharituber pfeilii]|nr:hypothetical protein BDZ91DRAFT_751189 [Kalaharituber pfeilii]
MLLTNTISYLSSCRDSEPCASKGTSKTTRKGFDFVIKHPKQLLAPDELGRPASTDLVRRIVNSFLKDLFNSGPNSHESPMIYSCHELSQDGSSISVQLRQRNPSANLVGDITTVCEHIHSLEGILRGVCDVLSEVGIFGLEPVPGTQFSICWDSAFFRQLLISGQELLARMLGRASQASNHIFAGSNWLRIGIVIFMSCVGTKAGTSMEQLLQTTFQNSAQKVGQNDAQVFDKKLKSALALSFKIMQQIAENAASTSARQEDWKENVQLALQSLDKIPAAMDTLLDVITNRQLEGHAVSSSTCQFYYCFRDAIGAAARAITTNTEIWNAFQAQFNLGFGRGAFELIKSSCLLIPHVVERTNPTLYTKVLAAVGFIDAVRSFCQVYQASQKEKLSKSLDECLRACCEVLFDCDGVTRCIYLVPSSASSSTLGSGAADSRKKLLDKLLSKINNVELNSEVTLENIYPLYMQAQGGMLKEALEKLRRINDQIQEIKN